MSEIDAATAGEAAPPPIRRIAFERLRERSDELELLISGLLAFALLTLPAHLFQAWAGNEVHADGVLSYSLSFGFTVVVGLCYSLGFAFVTHLAIRGYWVGLVGLKSSYPGGIQWDELPLVGPVSRAFYRHMIGDLGEVIDRVDRTASVLFATTILIALSIVWTGLLGLLSVIPAALVGLLFEDTERATLIGFCVLNAIVLTLSFSIPLLDKLVARRLERERPTQQLQRFVRGLLRVLTAIAPQRLIAPVQFTLQSNFGHRGFAVVYFLVPLFALLIGVAHIYNSLNFSPFNGYRVITTEAIGHGMHSAHYESMRGPDDVMLRYPMIPSDRIEARQLRLFIPHQPQLDNPRAREVCPNLEQGQNLDEGAAAARSAVSCVASMWTVVLDGKPLPLTGFLPMERRDLGMRGLVGYIDLRGKPPGRHDMQLLWNARGSEEGLQRRREFRIPFWYDPQGQ